MTRIDIYLLVYYPSHYYFFPSLVQTIDGSKGEGAWGMHPLGYKFFHFHPVFDKEIAKLAEESLFVNCKDAIDRKS